ncbi:Asparagine-rich protein [Bienertia sinuspersici]
MSRPGDWNCRSCSHLNFQRRDSCQRCGDSRPDARGGGDFGGFGGMRSVGPPLVAAGFLGPRCQARSSCFKCGAYKEEAGDGMGRSRGFSLVVELAVVAAVALAGNPVTGFAPGRVATSTTLPAGPSASDAGNQGTPAATLLINPSFSQVLRISG